MTCVWCMDEQMIYKDEVCPICHLRKIIVALETRIIDLEKELDKDKKILNPSMGEDHWYFHY